MGLFFLYVTWIWFVITEIQLKKADDQIEFVSRSYLVPEQICTYFKSNENIFSGIVE